MTDEEFFFDDPEKVLSSIPEPKVDDLNESRRRSSIGYKSKLFASAEDLSRQIRRQSIQILLTPGRSLIRTYSQKKMKALPANTKSVKFNDKENQLEKNGASLEDSTSPRKRKRPTKSPSLTNLIKKPKMLNDVIKAISSPGPNGVKKNT